MDPHSTEAWGTILGRLPSPEHTPVSEVVANRIIGDLVGYHHSSRHRVRDIKELANALEAYAQLVRDVPPEKTSA